MASNSFGEIFRITTWGESHGPAIGVTIDGCPAGIPITEDDINSHLKWRRPGRKLTSPRQEKDQAKILSGTFNNITTGSPILIQISNNDADSAHYKDIRNKLRPGHANFTNIHKYGIHDHRGGGRSSGRETACRVAAAAVAEKLLEQTEIVVYAYLSALGKVHLPDEEILQPISLKNIQSSPVFCPKTSTSNQMVAEVEKIQSKGNSLGGVVNFQINNTPAGLGDPIYQKLEAKLAYAMLSIPASKGFEIGSGFRAANLTGNQHNDLWDKNSQGDVYHTSNNCGGILAGISTGQPIYGKVAFKPTSSIKIPQKTVDILGNKTTLELPQNSRHDPCIAIRAVPVVKAMCLLVIADAWLANRLSKV